MKVKHLILATSGCITIGLGTHLAAWSVTRSAAPSIAPQLDALQPTQPRNPLIAKGVTAVPVAELVSKLKTQTQIPILIPSQIPISRKLYFSSQGTADSYTISIGYTPNCKAGACSFGEIRGEKGGSFSEKVQGVTKTLKPVQLQKGIKGNFHNGCGAYCTASVEWKDRDILYSISIKNGGETDTIAIANSAIQGGSR